MDFKSLFDELTMPVVIISIEKQEVIYYNKMAKSYLGLLQDDLTDIFTIFHPIDKTNLQLFLNSALTNSHHVQSDYHLEIDVGSQIKFINLKTVKYTDDANISLEVNVSGTGKGIYYICYIHDLSGVKYHKKRIENNETIREIIYETLQSSYHVLDIDAAILEILKRIGLFTDVSRVYIFEDSPDGLYTTNTYEWCNEGVLPQIEYLKNIAYADVEWTEIFKRDKMIVYDDITNMVEKARIGLESQGIKSIALLPLYKNDLQLGFVGFDECTKLRKWEQEDIQMLQAVAGIISTLISRKNAEKEAKNTQNMMRTVLDNLDTLIHVIDIKSGKILFANQKMKSTYNNMDLEGQLCWKALYKNDQPCSNCMNKRLLDQDGNPVGVIHKEIFNTVLQKWFYLSDTAIQWIDGNYVHLRQAVDITDRKKNEQLLEMYARTDMMTGVYKREWGIAKLKQYLQEIKQTKVPITVCFMDIDGLKYVNDNFGHTSGDAVIKTIVDVIKSRIRSTDTFCRFGGDEFILIMYGCSIVNARKVMNEIDFALTSINNSYVYGYDLSISKGLLEVSADMDILSVDEIIKLADKEMYKDKNKNKLNRYERENDAT